MAVSREVRKVLWVTVDTRAVACKSAASAHQHTTRCQTIASPTPYKGQGAGRVQGL
jgi:hypothetical protein